MQNLVSHGLYTVKDSYFSEFERDHCMDNKNEQRPYYYLFKDSDGVDWLIPMSKQVDNYAQKIAKEEAKRGVGNCIYYHIGKVASKDRAFLIGDMFPVSPAHVKAPYTICQTHYIVKNSKLNKEIHSKAMRYLQLVATGKMKSRNDIMGIKRVILNREREAAYMV